MAKVPGMFLMENMLMVKEQEESDRKDKKRKTDIGELCILNLEGEQKVFVKTILVL